MTTGATAETSRDEAQDEAQDESMEQETARHDRLDDFDEMAQLSRMARRCIDEYPLVTLGAVVLAGYLVGRMLRR